MEDRFADLGILDQFSFFDPSRLQKDGDEYLDEDQVDNMKVKTAQ